MTENSNGMLSGTSAAAELSTNRPRVSSALPGAAQDSRTSQLATVLDADIGRLLDATDRIDPIVGCHAKLVAKFGFTLRELLGMSLYISPQARREPAQRARDERVDAKLEGDGLTDLQTLTRMFQEMMWATCDAGWIHQTTDDAFAYCNKVLRRASQEMEGTSRYSSFHVLEKRFPIAQAVDLGLPACIWAPVPPIDYQRLRMARGSVSKALGAERLLASAPHLSEFLMMKSAQAERARLTFKRIDPIRARLSSHLDNLGLEDLWLVGPRAHGLDVQFDAPFDFLIDSSADAGSVYVVGRRLRMVLRQELGTLVRVHISHRASDEQVAMWTRNALPMRGKMRPILDRVDTLEFTDHTSDSGTCNA